MECVIGVDPGWRHCAIAVLMHIHGHHTWALMHHDTVDLQVKRQANNVQLSQAVLEMVDAIPVRRAPSLIAIESAVAGGTQLHRLVAVLTAALQARWRSARVFIVAPHWNRTRWGLPNLGDHREHKRTSLALWSKISEFTANDHVVESALLGINKYHHHRKEEYLLSSVHVAEMSQFQKRQFSEAEKRGLVRACRETSVARTASLRDFERAANGGNFQPNDRYACFCCGALGNVRQSKAGSLYFACREQNGVLACEKFLWKQGQQLKEIGWYEWALAKDLGYDNLQKAAEQLGLCEQLTVHELAIANEPVPRKSGNMEFPPPQVPPLPDKISMECDEILSDSGDDAEVTGYDSDTRVEIGIRRIDTRITEAQVALRKAMHDMKQLKRELGITVPAKRSREREDISVGKRARRV